MRGGAPFARAGPPVIAMVAPAHGRSAAPKSGYAYAECIGATSHPPRMPVVHYPAFRRTGYSLS